MKLGMNFVPIQYKERSQSRSSSQPKKANKPLRASESTVKNSVKKAREETVYSQSSESVKAWLWS